MENIKKNRGPIIALAALVVLIAAMAAAWFLTRPDTNKGAKELTIEVVHGDGSSREFTLTTEAEFLGEALLESKELGVAGETSHFGLYILEVDGEAASEEGRTYWAISLDGQELTVGADGQVIADGQHYELVLTPW